METNESLLDVVPVRPGARFTSAHCTHTCKHVPANLDEGKPTTIYRLRLSLSKGKAIEATLCRECYVQSQVTKN